MPSSTIQGRIAKFYFDGLRFPLTLAEHLGDRSGIDVASLPPVVVLEALEAHAKKVVGQFLGDDGLRLEGSQQESAVRHRSSAQAMEEKAQNLRESADEKLHETVNRAEKTRDRVADRTEQRLAEVEREEERAKQEAQERAKAREDAVRRAARTRQKAVEAKERQAELARVKARTEAVEKKAQAVQAEKVVSAIDDSLKK
jgi:hypothetical protein